jgi:hypothetical protein
MPSQFILVKIFAVVNLSSIEKHFRADDDVGQFGKR